jgi:hypothetical protein
MSDEKQLHVVLLKQWNTGIFNEQKMPILTLETFDGQQLSVFVTPQTAIELGEALKRTGEQTLAAHPTTTN